MLALATACLKCFNDGQIMSAKSKNRGNRGIVLRNHTRPSTSTRSISALCTRDTKYVGGHAMNATPVDCMLDEDIAGDTGE
jgi:hypothetical protein